MSLNKSVLGGVPIVNLTKEDGFCGSRLPCFTVKERLLKEVKFLREEASKLEKLANHCDKLDNESAEALYEIYNRSRSNH